MVDAAGTDKFSDNGDKLHVVGGLVDVLPWAKDCVTTKWLTCVTGP